MKNVVLLIFIVLLFGSCTTSRHTSFAGSTKHKPLNRALTKKEANRIAFRNWNLYTREGNKVYKTPVIWNTVRRPGNTKHRSR